jgi:hypothetical protein
METAIDRQMDTKFFIRIGDQVVNADNVVSFEIDRSDIVRIWYVGSPTPLILKAPVPSGALLEVLQGRQWLL